MNMPAHRVAIATALLGFLSFLPACSHMPVRQPIFTASGFDPVAVDTVALLPVADLRRDKTVDINVSQIVQKTALTAIRARRYSADASSAGPDYSRLTHEDLANPPAAWIEGLPPPNKRWIVVVCVHDITRKITFGSTGGAEVSAYLYDRQDGKLVWRDKGIGRAGQGGLLGMAMIGAMSQAALEAAVGNVFVGLPPKAAPASAKP